MCICFVCIKFFGHICPPHSAYTAPRPVPTGPVRAQMRDNSSRAGFAAKAAELNRHMTRVKIRGSVVS